MTGIAAKVATERYARKIQELSTQWPTAWHLLYPADDRMRGEHFPRILRRLRELARNGTPAPLWSATEPWSAVFLAAIGDDSYWDQYVRHPAAAWVARGSTGQASTVEDMLIRGLVPGGAAALMVPEERRTSVSSGASQSQLALEDAYGKGKGARKRKNMSVGQMRKSLGLNTRGKQVTEQPPPGGGWKGKGQGGGKGAGKGKKGQAALPAPQHTFCFGFTYRQHGHQCAGASPGSSCANSRLHGCATCHGMDPAAVDCPKKTSK